MANSSTNYDKSLLGDAIRQQTRRVFILAISRVARFGTRFNWTLNQRERERERERRARENRVDESSPGLGHKAWERRFRVWNRFISLAFDTFKMLNPGIPTGSAERIHIYGTPVNRYAVCPFYYRCGQTRLNLLPVGSFFLPFFLSFRSFNW